MYPEATIGVSIMATLRMDSMNPNVERMEYAVRGPLLLRALEIEKELKEGRSSKPYTKVIRANIGDAQFMGQTPITFVRQVIAGCMYPRTLEMDNLPADVKQRVNELLDASGGRSAGAYTNATGIERIRQHVAEFITQRDGGVESTFDNIYLCAGASEGIRALLNLFNRTSPDGKPPGVMIPIPQYPLYSATIAEYGMHQIGYYLDEANNWALDINELRRAITDAKSVCQPRVLCVINPGNPTGQVLSLENIQGIIRFAHEEKLFLFADEVYQENVYASGSKFHSFKRVLSEMGPPYSQMELASFHSVSKGFFGECGFRGGYAEVINLDPAVSVHYRKALSARLCPTTLGQYTVSCMVKPPKPGDPSYELYERERTHHLSSLAERARLIEQLFTTFPGMTCNPVQGAMYAFPQVKMPQKWLDKAKAEGKEPDFLYCMKLLETAGICVVPGSGFCQYPGTYHFRTTILPQTELLKEMLEKFKEFHVAFMQEYS